MAATTSSLEIAQAARPRPIMEVGAGLGIEPSELELHGPHKAKVNLSALDRLAHRPDGKLVAVTSLTPTPQGEGKTTTAISLVDGLARIGASSVLCLREPSLGPVFGTKGGAAGGGRAQLVPMEDLNLHFTGDIHAIGAANNLLAAMLDAHLKHGNELDIDPLSITWRRCLDINDRALREIVTGLGGRTNGVPRETGFDITAASEVMALLAVTRDEEDLRRRLGAITVASTRAGQPVTAEELGAAGSMAVLLRDALKPNLIQTLEGQPALVHTGPFANIALGNSSLVAALTGLKLADYVVTEGGFGSDMGLEKFLDIVCPAGGFEPSAIVIVATVQALRHHGDGDLWRGGDNLERHIGIARAFGFDPVVSLNRFPTDDDVDVAAATHLARELGVDAVVNEGYVHGGEGAEALARAVVRAADRCVSFAPLYDAAEEPIEQKIDIVARRVYGAARVELEPKAQRAIRRLTALELDRLPICMAKTPLSLSHDPKLKNSPEGFALPVRDVRAYTGAGWLVVLCGDVQTMPGLGAHPAAHAIDIEDGRVVGLF